MKILTKLYLLPAILAIGLMASPAGAQITNNSEFWISTNATGNLLSSGAPGNITSPLDGSSQANFDANMNGLPQNSTIHIMAGLYTTHGIGLKSGMKVLGSGIDVSILQFPPGQADNTTVISQSAVNATNIEISDLTCDANYTSGTATYAGIELEGTKHAVRRVKVENLARMSNSGSESWGIIIANYFLDKSDGNIIEDCEVSGFHNALPGANLSAISFLGSLSGIIRGCRVFGDTTNIVDAYGPRCGTILDGNYAFGVTIGIRSESSQSNVLVINNILKNCEVGVDFEGVANQNITIAFNEMDVSNGAYGSPVAINFGFNAGSQLFTNAQFIGNTFLNLVPGGGGGSAYGFRIEDVTGLVLAYNHLDTNFVNLVTNCVNASIDNNYDLTGNYLYSLNVPTLGAVPVTTFGLGLVSSANAGATLTTLGLPSNPVSVVTNFSTAPVNFNTNVTISGLLTISNGIASTISNGLSAAAVTLTSARYFGVGVWSTTWTNTTPDNIVVYCQMDNNGNTASNIVNNIYYNWSAIYTNIPCYTPIPTIILKPQSILGFTNIVSSSSQSFLVHLHWHPF